MSLRSTWMFVLADAYYNRGTAYARKSELDNAIADFTDAIRLNPKDANAYCNRSLAYKMKKDQAKAEADFAKAKELGYEPELSTEGHDHV